MFDSGINVWYRTDRKEIKGRTGRKEQKMNAKDDIMKALWANPNTQGIAQLMASIVIPAIANMPEEKQISAMGTVRDAVSDIAEYEECKKYMTETIKKIRTR